MRPFSFGPIALEPVPPRTTWPVPRMPSSELTMSGDHVSLDLMPNEIKASEFKATCLALLDEVADHRAEYVITKRGRPVAKLVPIDEPMSVAGSVRILVDDEDLLFTTGEAWTSD